MTFIFVLVGWVFSLCLHEFAHAAVAYLGGDTSVREKGYLTFNPLRYVDPVTSLVIPLVFLLLGGIGLPGGAVYIDRSRLRSKYWECAVALAGPAANLVFAAVLVLALGADLVPVNAAPAVAFLALLQVTAILLNLLPVPPLDGYGRSRRSFPVACA
jgi:Zn-dependent protease